MKLLTRRFSVLVFATMLLLGLASGCAKDPYTAAMAASLDVSNVVSDGLVVLTELKKDVLITQPEVATFAGYLGSVTTLNGTFRTSVKAIHASGTSGKAAYIAAAQVFVTAADDPKVLAAVHVSNPAAQAKVDNIVKGIQTALTGIQTAINSASGGA